MWLEIYRETPVIHRLQGVFASVKLPMFWGVK
jgi:hypothetical protein